MQFNIRAFGAVPDGGTDCNLLIHAVVVTVKKKAAEAPVSESHRYRQGT